MRVAFDVDDTLYTIQKLDGNELECPRWDVIDTLKFFKNVGCHIIVWSGGGEDYARMWARRLFIDQWVDEYAAKPKPEHGIVDIAFDDQEVVYGRVNVQV